MSFNTTNYRGVSARSVELIPFGSGGASLNVGGSGVTPFQSPNQKDPESPQSFGPYSLTGRGGRLNRLDTNCTPYMDVRAFQRVTSSRRGYSSPITIEGTMDKLMLDVLDRVADLDVKTRKQLAYLYQLSKDHPTSYGRKMAAIQHASLTNYLADVHEAWVTLKMALWPEKEKV